MNLAIIGTGYVGLTTGVCLSDVGHTVFCVDNDIKKINMLKKGKIPIYEPDLEEILKRNVRKKRLFFTSSIKEVVKKTEVIFICVGTPPREDGSADLSYIEDVATAIANNMDSYKLIVDKSTVPVETGKRVETTIKRNLKKDVPFDVASNPEFLREGTAVHDTMHPDRLVIGVSSKKAENILKQVYKPLKSTILVTDIKSAELIKHASNSFLATKISFINAVANICELCGADVEKVAEGMGLDKRIGRAFLNAGIGFGGFCFPKDLEAFLWISKQLGYNFDLLKSVKTINENQKKTFVKKIEDALWNLKGKTVAILGLAFKPNTDDMRFAPSITIISELQQAGAKIKAYDPKAQERAKEILKNVTYCRTPYETVKGADCLAILTEWEDVKNMDLSKVKKLLKHPIIIDGRNVFDPEKIKSLGFVYKSIGR
ncbi:MAG: UDP-glucose 6-dehydrogenase TuaD [Elusimicrobia bacterium ADurb.Bin231]|nr:MAG: UDP-glucose 6-dehydrogenase TuaD [Elusimicrobia bacterium ADurb.Bin231]